MSKLRIFPADMPQSPTWSSRNARRIAEKLAEAGIRFERWRPRAKVSPGAPPAQILEAFKPDIERLKAEGGYQAVDVVSLAPNHPQKDELRKKFLDEHTHAEDEVRFFVAGGGLFSIHREGRVYEMECRAGDLIALPAGTTHWFDMGPTPSFVAIRLFINPAGWVAQFTGSDIASRFPRYERAA
ncbi:MAG: acireductone dioxygenase [Xanthomonadales bacterium]|jgi:1,2-dihydroxy-3-keto-5-methylthiopentene dioxygenase|nr:acireductone dioxygenase [Xanthomonadales bacterium]